MGTNELGLSYKAWSKRISQYQQLGLPESVYLPIAKHDMAKTYQSGSAPMTDLEANIAIAAAASGTPPITETPRHGHGLLGSIATVASNIVPDVGNLITGLPRGIYDAGKQLTTPSDWGQAFDLLAHPERNKAFQAEAQAEGTDPASFSPGMGASARIAAHTPILDVLLPFLSTESGLSTKAGRLGLEEHPVSTLLSTAGLAGGVVKSAGTEALARSGQLGDLASQGVDIGDKAALAKALKENPSAPAALARGHLVQGAARAADRAVTRRLAGQLETDILSKTDDQLGAGQKLTRTALRKLKHDRINNEFNTAANREQNGISADAAQYERTVVRPLVERLGGHAEAEAYAAKAKAGEPGWQAMNDEERAVYDLQHALERQVQDRGVAADRYTRTTEGIFPKDSMVGVAWRAMGKRALDIEAQTAKVERYKTRLKAAQERNAGRAIHRDPVKQTRIAKGALERADIIQRHTERLANEERTHTAMKAAHGHAREVYQKALLRTPPAHLQPLMIQFMRDKAEESLRTGEGPAKAAQAQFLSETEDWIRDPKNTSFVQDLKNWMGKEEYNATLADSLEFALAQTRGGHPPLYFPNVAPNAEQRFLTARIGTATPEHFRSRILNIADSSNSVVLALQAPYVSELEYEAGQRVLTQALVPHGKYSRQIDGFYTRAAEAMHGKGRVRHYGVPKTKQALRDEQWVKISPTTGERLHGVDHPDDFYVPKDLYENWEYATGKAGHSQGVLESRAYQRSMRVFRGSVLYGPRHFVHVTIAGQMPVYMADPTAVFEIAHVWPELMKMKRGEEPDETIIPKEYQRAPASYKSGEGTSFEMERNFKWLQGRALARLYGQAVNVSDGLARIEDLAQVMFQSTLRLRALKRGEDPTEALELGRRAVVNMDSASPFERTIMKQVMPFYSFTRFATLFLLRYPFDHPLRASFLASISNQAQEEWGTGLPMNLMDLFFIGPQHESGNQTTVNLKNVNPFRSIANTFTLGGFLSGLNPAIQAAATAFGINTLSGSAQMYPEISYNAQTGDLQTDRPKNSMWKAIESFVPEFSAVDARLGLSDNYRYLYTNDRQAFWRQMWSDFNLPFTPSDYNIPQVRGKVALNLYKGAEQAAYQAKRSGDFSGDISRYNLIPANLTGTKTSLYTPEQVQGYWKNLEAEYAQTYPGVNVGALVPKP